MTKQYNVASEVKDVLIFAINTQSVLNKAKAVLDDGKSSVSQRLLEVAQHADNVDQFLQCCANAELEYKAEHTTKGGKAPNIPSCWTQAKSNIKQAFAAGIDVKEHKTESEMRKALNETRKEKAAEKEAIQADRIKLEVPAEMAVLFRTYLGAYKANPEAVAKIAQKDLASLQKIIKQALPNGEPIAPVAAAA